ncbi:MAG: hypothetical protein ACQZ3M_08540 [cyanobacterium endosymbiont of Rhopalodia fuxianensis]
MFYAFAPYTDKIQTLKKKYSIIFEWIKLLALIFIDRTGVYLAMTRHFARATNEGWINREAFLINKTKVMILQLCLRACVVIDVTVS